MNRPVEGKESPDPHPSALVNFIQTVTEMPWPSAENQFHKYFEHLGCVLKPASHNDDAPLGVSRGAFVTRHSTMKNASWAALDRSLFFLGFFAYEDAVDVVDAGYDEVRNSLISLYGRPFDDRLSPLDNRSAVWLVKETEIELYAHVSLAPALQIGLSHKDRNAAYEHRLTQVADKQKP